MVKLSVLVLAVAIVACSTLVCVESQKCDNDNQGRDCGMYNTNNVMYDDVYITMIASSTTGYVGIDPEYCVNKGCCFEDQSETDVC